MLITKQESVNLEGPSVYLKRYIINAITASVIVNCSGCGKSTDPEQVSHFTASDLFYMASKY